jgi:oligopeptide transport system permease protein
MWKSNAEAASAELQGTLPRHRGPWEDALRQLARNRAALVGLVIILTLALLAIAAPLVAPYHFAEDHLEDNYASPGSQYVLGADFLGRDLLSRLIYGARVSLTVGVVGATMATLIGVIWGAVAGYRGGLVGSLMMRFVDLMYGFPTLLLIILIMVYFRASAESPGGAGFIREGLRSLDSAVGGTLFIFIGIAITSWMTMARLVRGMVLSLKESDYVMAARATGASGLGIIWRHLTPNFLGPVIVAETLNIPTYILYEAFLSFIGLGVNPPMPSWGAMIDEGMASMRSNPHLVLFPSAALALTLLAFNFLGDGLRDALDPRLRRAR